MRQPARRTTPAHARANLRGLSAVCEQCETRGRCPRRTLNVFNQPAETISFGITDSHRGIKHLFSDLSHAVQQRAATSQHNSARELSLPTRIFDLVSDVHQHFFSARLQNVAKYLARELAWRTSTN